tara:strand:- start:264 stop:953 length:690 start_codon:yes stop_codon:yes gene_type:complete
MNMKKLLISALMILTSYTMASAELGIKVGVSAQIGTMETKATEKSTDAAITDVSTPNEETMFGAGTYFIEKELSFLPGPLSRLSIGYDNIGHDLDLGSASRTVSDRLGSTAVPAQAFTNQASAEVTGFDSFYATINITDWLYVKGGSVDVAIKTTEKLESGGSYPDVSMDGVVMGLGVHGENDAGLFFRLELNEYSIDGATVANSTGKRSILIGDISGTTARVSVGKSF